LALDSLLNNQHIMFKNEMNRPVPGDQLSEDQLPPKDQRHRDDQANFLSVVHGTQYLQHRHEQVIDPALLQTAPTNTSSSHQSPKCGQYYPPTVTSDNPITPADTLIDLQASSNGNGARVPRSLEFASLEDAREYRRRVTRPPELNPEDDPTIPEVERDSHIWIKKLVEAMYNLEDVGDKPNAMHRTFFTVGHRNEYPYKDIESACYELHAAVIDRSRYGYRGPKQDDKAYKKGSKVKKNVADEQEPNNGTFEVDCIGNCATRMQNVVDGLWVWKNSCAQVVYDDRQQRLMANHPFTFANNKGHNKKCNDKKKETSEAGRKAVAELAEVKQNQEQTEKPKTAKKARTTRNKQPTTNSPSGYTSRPFVSKTQGHQDQATIFDFGLGISDPQNNQNLFMRHQPMPAHSHGYFDQDHQERSQLLQSTSRAERRDGVVHRTLAGESAPEPPLMQSTMNMDSNIGRRCYSFASPLFPTAYENRFDDPSIVLSPEQDARLAYNTYGGQANTYNLHHANAPGMSYNMGGAINMPNPMRQMYNTNERAPPVAAGLRDVPTYPIATQSRAHYENGGNVVANYHGGHAPTRTLGSANSFAGYGHNAQTPRATSSKRKREGETLIGGEEWISLSHQCNP
jgi:hypothetical protein